MIMICRSACEAVDSHGRHTVPWIQVSGGQLRLS